MKKKRKNVPQPLPVTAEEPAYQLPPSSYEEILGAYQTSMKEVNVDMPTLAYIDLMPKCLNSGNIAGNVAPKFCGFSTLLEAANRLLLENPNMAVWKCETVTKKVSWDKSGKISYELNTMLRHESTQGFIVFIKILRIWLIKDPRTRGPPQQIGLRNIVPHKMSVELAPGRRNRGGGRANKNGERHVMTNDVNEFETLENVCDTMERLQETLAKDPIPGTILTIETDRTKASDDFKSDLDIDPELSSWSENKARFRRFVHVIRIFYIEGPSAKGEVGFEEFVPEVSSVGTANKPATFEPFENLINRLAFWVSVNQGLRIVNIQQYDAIVNKQSDEAEVCSDSMDDLISNIHDQRFVRTLRVFYAKSFTVRALPANFLTYRLFLPARTGPKTFETMTQTMERIEAWLRITGLPIYSVETVELLFDDRNRLGAECEQSDYTVLPSSEKLWLTAIRVYFTTPISEPDLDLLPPLPAYATNGKGSKSCNIM